MKLVDSFSDNSFLLSTGTWKKRNITKTIFKLSFAKLFVNQSTKKKHSILTSILGFHRRWLISLFLPYIPVFNDRNNLRATFFL